MQPNPAAPYSAGGVSGVPGEARAAYPIWRYGLLFGALSGLFAILQLAVSVTSAVENQAAYASLYYGTQNQALNPNVLLGWLGPVLVATYTSCLLGFALSMWLCWHAGRAAAASSGRASTGALAGMVASMVGSAIWIVASVVAVALVHTDGSISGILTANPARSNVGGEIAGLVLQEAVAALIALGLAAVAGRMGGAAASTPAQAAARATGQPPAPPAPGMPYFTGYAPSPIPPGAPALMPPPQPPFVVAPMYPPPPEFYQAQRQGTPYAYPPLPLYPNTAGMHPPTAYPGYPPMPWSPPVSPAAPPPAPAASPPRAPDPAAPDAPAPPQP